LPNFEQEPVPFLSLSARIASNTAESWPSWPSHVIPTEWLYSRIAFKKSFEDFLPEKPLTLSLGQQDKGDGSSSGNKTSSNPFLGPKPEGGKRLKGTVSNIETEEEIPEETIESEEPRPAQTTSTSSESVGTLAGTIGTMGNTSNTETDSSIPALESGWGDALAGARTTGGISGPPTMWGDGPGTLTTAFMASEPGAGISGPVLNSGREARLTGAWISMEGHKPPATSVLPVIGPINPARPISSLTATAAISGRDPHSVLEEDATNWFSETGTLDVRGGWPIPPEVTEFSGDFSRPPKPDAEGFLVYSMCTWEHLMLLMIFRLLIKKKYIRRGWRVFSRFIRYEVGDET